MDENTTYKVCYITTVSNTLKAFVLKSALYNKEKGGWHITFICNTSPTFQEELPDCINYIPITIKRGISLTGIKTTIDLYRIFRKEKFDLVQYSTSNAGCYASLAAKMANIPIRLYCQWGLDYPVFSGIKRIMFKSIERLICKCSTNVQPDSFGNLEIAIHDGLYDENKGTVVGCGSASGVDLNKFDYSLKKLWRNEIRTIYSIPFDSVVIGYVGRMVKDKGINELLEVAKRIIDDEGENAYLLLVGRNDSQKGIDKEMLKWAHNSSRVIFTGVVSETEKYYSAMDIFCLPSYHEGFGTSVIEAESMGVPVVVTDIPGPREGAINGTTGLTVPPKNTEELYKALCRLIENNSLRTQFGNEGLKYVTQKYNQTELFKEIYNNRLMLLSSYK